MENNSCKEVLLKAGVSEASMELLLREEMLDTGCLQEATDELLRTVGLKGGQIVKIRKALPATPKCATEALCPVLCSEDPPIRSSKDATPTQQPKPLLAFQKSSLGTLQSNFYSIELPSESTLSARVQEGLSKKCLVDAARNEFVRDVCNKIRLYTLYPTQAEREHVAHLITSKYPFLKDSIGSGFGSWTKSIRFRLKNIRKRKGHGSTDTVFAELHVDHEVKAIAEDERKKTKCQWPGSLPCLPDGETTDTCNDHKKKMIKEMEKNANRNLALIKGLMDITYPFRRRYILTEPQPINSLLKEYPALQLPTELKREFGRILGKKTLVRDCTQTFTLKWSGKIVAYGKKTPAAKAIVEEMVIALEENATRTDTEAAAAIALLPLLLKEKKGKDDIFLKIVSDDDEKLIDAYISESTSPRIVGAGDMFTPDPLYICMEGRTISLRNSTLLDATVVLLACYYAFNMQYPPNKNVFLFLEAVLLDKTDNLKGRVSLMKFLNALDQ